MMRGECTAGMNRMSPTEGNFSEVDKRNLISHIHKHTNSYLDKTRWPRNMF